MSLETNTLLKSILQHVLMAKTLEDAQEAVRMLCPDDMVDALERRVEIRKNIQAKAEMQRKEETNG